MDKILELKTNIIVFVEKNEAIVKATSKFLLMLIAYLMVYFLLGFYARIHKPIIPVALATIGAFVPTGVSAFLLGGYLLANLYGLGIEVTGVTAILLLLCYILYFRFASGKSYLLIMTPIAWAARIPYVLPVTVGLTTGAGSVVPVMMGTVMYYYLKGLRANTSLFMEAGSMNAMGKLSAAVNIIGNNKEFWLVLGSFLITGLVVTAIRKRSIRNAWRLAIYTGVTMQTVMILVGRLMFGSTEGIVELVVGSIVCMGLDLLVEFFLFHLDYTRVEKVQFEDDYYYYYVKAVPKVMVQAREKKVTTFKGNTEENSDSEQ